MESCADCTKVTGIQQATGGAVESFNTNIGTFVKPLRKIKKLFWTLYNTQALSKLV